MFYTTQIAKYPRVWIVGLPVRACVASVDMENAALPVGEPMLASWLWTDTVTAGQTR